MNHLIILFMLAMFIHLRRTTKDWCASAGHINSQDIQRFMQLLVWLSFTFCSSQTSRVSGNVFNPPTCYRVQGESGQHACMTLQATPGHIWTGDGSSALTPAHLDLTHSEEARGLHKITLTQMYSMLFDTQAGMHFYTKEQAYILIHASGGFMCI